MLTLPVEAWIGNAASVVIGAWGAVTRRAEQSGYSRTAIYQHAERVVQAVANEQASGAMKSCGLKTSGSRPKMRRFGMPGQRPKTSVSPNSVNWPQRALRWG